MLEPRLLYTLHDDVPKEVLAALRSPGGGRPLTLVHALQGFVDAGAAATLVACHLLDALEHHPVATFAIDELMNYRTRRPAMVYDHDHYVSYEAPSLVLYAVRDLDGSTFLLLAGPEPDLQWERFVAAVRELIEHFGVASTVALHGIGMAVPHTRPTGVISHANRPDLVPPGEDWPGVLQIPGSAASLMELRLGEWGHDALGFVVQVPTYLADASYPDAAVALLDRLADHLGLTVPRRALLQIAEQTREALAEQLAGSADVARVVDALEHQYDALAGSRERASLLAVDDSRLPSADELGAEVERFLAAEEDGDR